MPSWPADWPTEVRDFYATVAHERRWPTSIVEGVIASVEHVRSLTESERPREHFFGHADAADWFFETVAVEGENVVIRQVVVNDDRTTSSYSWRHLEDADGALSDAALDPAGLQRIGAGAFAEAWRRAG